MSYGHSAVLFALVACFTPATAAEPQRPHIISNAGLAYMRMIRTDPWKLVHFHYANGLDELYNLRDDPGETRNVIRDPNNQKIVADLRARLLAWQKSIDDPLLRK